jgi:hypothetical protein
MAPAFILVCELGFGKFESERFGSEESAKSAAKGRWCCWTLFQGESDGTSLVELAQSPRNWRASAIRKWAEANVKSKQKDVEARSAAAAAAEARAAKAAQSKPREPRPSQQQGAGNDGKPDVSNPIAWD